MLWTQDYELLTNAEQERFKKVTNYLLNHNFVLREVYEQRDRIGKINADYRFIERNLQLFSEYLEYAGYTVNKDDTYGIVYLTSPYEFNVARLDKFTTLFLLILRTIYDEEKEKNAMRNVIFIRVSDIIVRMIDEKLILKKPTIKEYSDTLRNLIKHNVVSRLEGQIEDPTCLITIYPTITKIVSNEKINALYNNMFKAEEEKDFFDFDKEEA